MAQTSIGNPTEKTPAEYELNLPLGFQYILEKLTRAIIRTRPKNIPSFSAKYLQLLCEQTHKEGENIVNWRSQELFREDYVIQNCLSSFATDFQAFAFDLINHLIFSIHSVVGLTSFPFFNNSSLEILSLKWFCSAKSTPEENTIYFHTGPSSVTESQIAVLMKDDFHPSPEVQKSIHDHITETVSKLSDPALQGQEEDREWFWKHRKNDFTKSNVMKSRAVVRFKYQGACLLRTE